MPEAIAFIASTGVEIFGFEIATSTILATTLVVAYGEQQQRKARAAYNASLKDREVMLRSAVAPRRVIYGRDRVSGPVVYAQSTGDKGQYLHLVIALAAHECDAVEEIWFNDVKLPALSGAGYVTSGEFARVSTNTKVHSVTVPVGGTVTLPEAADDVQAVTYQYGMGESGSGSTQATGWAHTSGSADVTGLTPGEPAVINYTTTGAVQPVRIKVHLGGAGQVADADLVAESGGTWTSAHVGAGICYLYARLEYDQEIFGQIGVPNITAVVRGKKVLDPRTSTTAWSDNAALCVANWLQDSRYGLGAAAAEVPDAEVIAAANICDEVIELDVGGATTQKRYTFNGSFTADQSPRDVLSDLLTGMAGHCVWSQGRWLVRPGAYRAPSLTITADHLAGQGVSIVPKASRSDLFNAVRVMYRDPAQGWAEVQAPLVTNAMYEAEDGGRRIVRTIQLPSVMDHWRAQRHAKIELERARQALTVQLVGNLKTYDLAPTDTAALTLSRYGFSGKAFEVRERTWSPEGTLAYTLRETAAGVWAWAFGEATAVDLAPDTELPNPYAPPAALSNLTVESGTAHLLRMSDGTIVARAWVQWTASTDAFVLQGGRIEIGWKTDDADDWQVAPALTGDAINTYLGPMPDARVVLIRVRPVNASGRSGAWTTITATVLGKSAPASDVTGLAYAIKPGQVAMTWNPCTDLDYAVTELREGATWASGTLLWSGAAREYQHPRPPNGTYTVWAAHQDTSGNYSATPASISVTVDDSIDSGTVGDSVYVEWSVDGSTAWHATFAAGDLFARWKVGVAGAWQGPFRVVGETGAAGDYTDFIFKRSATQPATPTGNTPAGWADAPPAADGNPLWASLARKTDAGVVVGVWATPVQIEGASATVISARATPSYITRTKAGTFSPNAITFEIWSQTGAAAPALANGYWSFYKGTGSTSYTWGTAISGNGAIYSGQSDLGTTLTASHTALKFEVYADAGRTQLLDTLTVPIVNEGSDAITGYLTNESVTLAADSSGTISGSISTLTSGIFKVFKGATDVTASATFGAPTNTGCTVATPTAGTGAYSASAMSADYATSVMSASYGGVTITKTLVLAKARAGVNGTNGTNGSNGAAGTRGTRQLYLTSASYTSGYGAGNYATAATSAIASATAGSTPTTPINGDTVTFTNGTDYTYTITHNGSSWVPPGTVIDGSLLVTGSITTTKLAANSLTADKITSATTAYNGISFALGSSASIAGYNAAMAVTSSTSARYAALFANTTNQTGAGGIAVGVNNGSSYAGTFLNANDASFTQHRTRVDLALNQQAGSFVNLASDYTSIDSKVLLCDNAYAVWIVTGTLRIDQTPTTGAAAANNSAGSAALVNKPGSASNNSWLSINLGGTTYYVPVWT